MPTYTVTQLITSAQALLGVAPYVAAGAFYGLTGSYTVAQAASILNTWLGENSGSVIAALTQAQADARYAQLDPGTGDVLASQLPPLVSVTPPNNAAVIEGWINGNAYGTAGGAVNGNGVLLSANLTWPDGATGVYTANTIDGGTNAVTSCSYTYVWTGGSHAFTETVTIDPSSGAALSTSITETN